MAPALRLASLREVDPVEGTAKAEADERRGVAGVDACDLTVGGERDPNHHNRRRAGRASRERVALDVPARPLHRDPTRATASRRTVDGRYSSGRRLIKSLSGDQALLLLLASSASWRARLYSKHVHAASDACASSQPEAIGPASMSTPSLCSA